MKKIIEIKENVKIVQEDKIIILEKGDRIRISEYKGRKTNLFPKEAVDVIKERGASKIEFNGIGEEIYKGALRDVGPKTYSAELMGDHIIFEKKGRNFFVFTVTPKTKIQIFNDGDPNEPHGLAKGNTFIVFENDLYGLLVKLSKYRE